MRVYASQFYIEYGITYPLSFYFQDWLSEELSNLVEASEDFHWAYPNDFDLMFRISAKANIKVPLIFGPTIYRREKSVEFTIFLTHSGRYAFGQETLRPTVVQLLDQVVEVLRGLGIDAERLKNNIPEMVEHFVSTPAMIES